MITDKHLGWQTRKDAFMRETVAVGRGVWCSELRFTCILVCCDSAKRKVSIWSMPCYSFYWSHHNLWVGQVFSVGLDKAIMAVTMTIVWVTCIAHDKTRKRTVSEGSIQVFHIGVWGAISIFSMLHLNNVGMTIKRSHLLKWVECLYAVSMHTRFLLNCGCGNTTVWMHLLDINKMYREKAGWELGKSATCCFEQILEATPHKTAAIWPLTSLLTNHPRWIRHVRHWWRRKDDDERLTYNRSVQSLDVFRMTCQEQWIIGMDSKRESEKFDLMMMCIGVDRTINQK